MSTGTMTRLMGGRPARRSTAAGEALFRAEALPPAASVVMLAVANGAIAIAIVVLSLALF
jgi:hypothetical protein